MSEIIIEIVIGVLILTLAGMLIIPLYNQTQDIINGILYGSVPDAVEKSLFGLGNEFDYKGAEIIAQIDHFSSYENRVITVINDTQSRSYRNEKYDPSMFHISLHEGYSFSKSSSSGYVEYIYTINYQ